jgi:hypothetical protein
VRKKRSEEGSPEVTRRRVVAAHILRLEGVLLLTVAGIHLAVIPELRSVLVRNLDRASFSFAWPPFLLNHVVVGILLIPIGVSTIFCASGVRAGERWAWRVGMSYAIAVLTLPAALVAIMDRHYFTAVPFLTAAILVGAVGISMAWPLIWVRRELS